MMANTATKENELLQWAVLWLRERLPSAWSVDLAPQGTVEAGQPDTVIRIQAQNVHATLAVEAKRSLPPRDVDRLLGGVGRTLRAIVPQVQILIVAAWLSPRTRELLRAEGLNYLDQTGNASIQLENPAMFIEAQGSNRDPAPAPRAKARIRGPKAGRLVRTLVDVRPPYGVRELASAAALAPGYVSRLLDALDEEALIERGRRGRVEAADVRGLLRRWADGYDVFKANETATFVAPRGPGAAFEGLGRARGIETAVTGSFAAVRFAPVAAPALLAVYCEEVDALADALDLLPADKGANVALLRPFDPVVWQYTDELDGMRFVSPSQAATDCITGTGRMPAEGEALLDWLAVNEPEWRRAGLTDGNGAQP